MGISLLVPLNVRDICKRTYSNVSMIFRLGHEPLRRFLLKLDTQTRNRYS
jgi:hypothetical protein